MADFNPKSVIEVLDKNPEMIAELTPEAKAHPDIAQWVDSYTKRVTNPFSIPTAPEGTPPDFVGKAKQAVVGALGGEGYTGVQTSPDVREPSFLRRGMASVADLMLPGSVEQAAIDLATAGGGKISGAAERAATQTTRPLTTTARTLLSPRAAALAERGINAMPGIVRGATNIAAPAVAGGVAAEVMGKSPEEVSAAIKTGGVAGMIAEGAHLAGRGVNALTGRFGHPDYAPYQNAVRERLGPQFATAVTKDIPSLSGAVTDTTGLAELPERGARAFGDLYRSNDAATVKALGAGRVLVPSEAYAIAQNQMPASPFTTRGMAKQLPPGMIDVSPEEAIRIGRLVEDKARSIGRADGAQRFEHLQLAKQVRDQITNAVRAVDPAVAAERAQINTDYGKFVALRDLINEQTPTRLFPARPRTGPTMDLPKLYEALANSEDITTSRFPEVFKFFRGTEPGAVGPIRSTLNPLGARVYPRIGNIHTGENVKLPSVKLTPALEEQLAPRTGPRLGTLGRAGAIAATPSIAAAKAAGVTPPVAAFPPPPNATATHAEAEMRRLIDTGHTPQSAADAMRRSGWQ